MTYLPSKKHKIHKDTEDTIMEKMAQKYLPYWPLFLLAVLPGIFIAFTYLRYTTPVYEATATLIVKDERKGNEGSKMIESLDLISAKKIVENEIEIIQSRTLMTQVVKALALYAPLVEKGKVKAISAYTKSPILIEAQNPEAIREVERVPFFFDKTNQTVILNSKHKYPLNEFAKTPYGYLKFTLNKNCTSFYNIADTLHKKLYFSLRDPGNVAQDLLSNLAVQASSKMSSVVELSYKDEIPKRGENILNQLIYVYDESAISEKNRIAKNTLAFVQDRLNAVTLDLEEIERKVQNFKSSTGSSDISRQGQLFLQNVSANDQKLSEVNAQLSILNQVQKSVISRDNGESIVPSTLGINDPMLSQLLDKLYSYELDYEKLKRTVGQNNPTILAVNDQINKIRPNILQNIESQKQSLNAAKNNLNLTNGSYNSILHSVPQKERQLLDISREQATKNSIYAFLLQKREETELSYASAVSDHLVVDRAKSGRTPVSPKKGIVYFMAVIACMGLCVALVTIKESFTGKILYRNEIESRTLIPVIAEVAFNKSKNPIVIQPGKRSFIAEEFRRLRTSLSFLGIDPQHKKILVTSSISGEGKSFIAANLALSMASTGKKVVLVDMDLNMPTLHKILGVTQEEGITQFLLGEKSPTEIIRTLASHQNLSFISAGGLPDGPTELLANGKVKEILEFLNREFDVVVVDTSPIVLVTDAYILSELCDATLYVVRHKYTPKLLIKRIDENNQVNPITNPAIIFNGVKMRGFYKNGYGYGYNYVYGRK